MDLEYMLPAVASAKLTAEDKACYFGQLHIILIPDKNCVARVINLNIYEMSEQEYDAYMRALPRDEFLLYYNYVLQFCITKNRPSTIFNHKKMHRPGPFLS